ncbi:IclR family acetate operon transcriptional repressor [Mumia flava]|uniref:IclR family acetate operon transcriptional repressor n=1 Tax=Mumia flava TaxID=1348852 RepID=A0A2M9BDH6_9ACTN|nr:IclR family transcriptional regulator [Mumia flava]PJJ56010.1 IclR family acetate operon transcriptional repressor [Mumia flava]
MGNEPSGRGVSTSVVHAFEILDQVAAAGSEGITLAALSGGASKARSTTHRYVTTLLQLGVLCRDDGGRLHLGARLLALATELLDGDILRSVAKPILATLGAETGETVHLGVPTGGQITYIDKVESSHSVRLVSGIGHQIALYCTSMGKAVLSRLPPEDLDAVLASPRPAVTAHTLTGRDELLAELARIRASGVSMDAEENELGVCCVGAAVVDRRSRPVAAISVSGPAARMTASRRAEIAPLVRDAARAIEEALGYRGRVPAPVPGAPTEASR